MLAASMALMISGIAFPVFILTASANAMAPDFTHLRYVSVVSAARGGEIDPHTAAQIRSHPAVARIIPAVLIQLRVIIPPGGESEVDIYGVAEDDLPQGQETFLELNAELAKEWPVISQRKDPLPDAEEWNGKPGKRELLER